MIKNFREDIESASLKSNQSSFRLVIGKTLNNETLNQIVEENESEGSQKSEELGSNKSVHDSK